MPPSPAGLAPEGIPRPAQAALHRELLHVHGLLDLTLAMLRYRFAITSPPFLDQVSSPHIRTQLRGLDSGILPATEAVSAALYYTQEPMTTFGLIHTLTQSPEQLDAELRGRTSFLDPRTFHSPVSSSTTPSGTTTWASTLGTTLARSRSGPSSTSLRPRSRSRRP